MMYPILMSFNHSSDKIFIWGMPGAGKSTFGQKLAAQLECPYTDMDSWICEKYGKSIPEIFNELGEVEFRAMEHEAVQTITREISGVVATGGGAPCFFDNARIMNEAGLTIFLDTPLLTIYNRLRNRKGRPLLDYSSDLYGELKRTYAVRETWYSQAAITIKKETTDLLLEIDRFFTKQ